MVEAQLQNIHTRRAFHARTQAVLTNPDTSWCCFRLVGDSSKTSLELRIFKVFSYTGPFLPCLVTVGLIHVGSGPITPSNPLKLRRGSPALPFLWCGSRAGCLWSAHGWRWLLSLFWGSKLGMFPVMTWLPGFLARFTTGWWFGTFLLFHILGIIIPTD